MWNPAVLLKFNDVSKERNGCVFRTEGSEGRGGKFLRIFFKFLSNNEGYPLSRLQVSTVIIARDFGRALDLSELQRTGYEVMHFCKLSSYTHYELVFSAVKGFAKIH